MRRDKRCKTAPLQHTKQRRTKRAQRAWAAGTDCLLLCPLASLSRQIATHLGGHFRQYQERRKPGGEVARCFQDRGEWRPSRILPLSVLLLVLLPLTPLPVLLLRLLLLLLLLLMMVTSQALLPCPDAGYTSGSSPRRAQCCHLSRGVGVLGTPLWRSWRAGWTGLIQLPASFSFFGALGSRYAVVPVVDQRRHRLLLLLCSQLRLLLRLPLIPLGRVALILLLLMLLLFVLRVVLRVLHHACGSAGSRPHRLPRMLLRLLLLL